MLKQLKYWVKKTFLGFRFNATEYWEQRYKQGGNSGAGSYNQLAQFKANTINQFVEEKGIETILELGCGDGNQLALFNAKKYIGLDVSPTIIEACKAKFELDKTKSFFLIEEYFSQNPKAVQLSISLDVLYHLTDDSTFKEYMRKLFQSSSNYVLIYSSNRNTKPWETATHIRHHKFTDQVAEHFPNWQLKQTIKNPFPVETYGPENGSIADFYWFEKNG